MTQFPSLVSPQWLLNHLDHPQLVIVDCRFQLGQPQWGYQQYTHSHLPNAVYLDLEKDLSAPIAQHGGRHPLPPPDSLAQTFSAIGIESGTSWVVAYDDARFAFASRLWWLLRYLGHESVALLDGGWNGWQSQGYPVSDVMPPPKFGHFIPYPQTDWIVDIETVKIRKDDPKVILLDSREGDRYRGEREPIDPLAGSIPGAVNSPWKHVTDEQGYCLALTHQRQLWRDYQSANEIIVYCGSGVTACVNLFSMNLVNIEQTKLYAGGWSDWCSYR